MMSTPIVLLDTVAVQALHTYMCVHSIDSGFVLYRFSSNHDWTVL